MKKWLDKLCGKIWWKKLGGQIAWKSLVEEFFWKNLVVILCGKIGWKPCFKCFCFFFYAANWEEQFGGKIYGQNVLEKLG